MNRNSHNLNLDQLLADVEHAGRDARRREQLSAMIDQMAGETESGKNRHGFWWWSGRVAAAACVLFFISTAVRVWFIPTENATPMVAENRMESDVIKVERVDSAVATPVKTAAPRRVVSHRSVVPVVESTVVEKTEPIEEVTLPEIEELVAEEIESQEEEPVEELEESAVESIAAPIVSVAYCEPQAQPQERPQEQPRRRSLLGGLIRQPEPDDMTGTVLAFRIL